MVRSYPASRRGSVVDRFANSPPGCHTDHPFCQLGLVSDRDRENHVLGSDRLEPLGFDLAAIRHGRSGSQRLEPLGSGRSVGCPLFVPPGGCMMATWLGCDRPGCSRMRGFAESTRVLESTPVSGRRTPAVDCRRWTVEADRVSRVVCGLESPIVSRPAPLVGFAQFRTNPGRFFERRCQFRRRWNGWYRCWVLSTVSFAPINLIMIYRTLHSSSQLTYQGLRRRRVIDLLERSSSGDRRVAQSRGDSSDQRTSGARSSVRPGSSSSISSSGSPTPS